MSGSREDRDMSVGTEPPSPVRGAAARRYRAPKTRSRFMDQRPVVLLGAVAVVVVIGVGIAPEWTPFTALMIPLLVGSLVLNPRQLPWFVVSILGLVTVALLLQPVITPRVAGAAAVQFVMCVIVLVTAFRRTRLGVAGFTGESMFVDLRDRLLRQGRIPDLPPDWHLESALVSASGTRFAGDFVVATYLEDDARLELVVVDVSGKGDQAGTRALQLSGAFGGMLGSVAPQMFLASANDYLLRQDWAEGFATAIHLALWVDTGEFEIRSAGHPPAVLRAAGSGRWTVLESSGAVLGLLPYAEFTTARGQLRAGDALMLYTDGMVEEPQRDLDLGLDRMLGQAEGLLRAGVVGSAERLVEALGSRDDDRAMVVVHRK